MSEKEHNKTQRLSRKTAGKAGAGARINSSLVGKAPSPTISSVLDAQQEEGWAEQEKGPFPKFSSCAVQKGSQEPPMAIYSSPKGNETYDLVPGLHSPHF